ncbi:MAG: flavin reductase family protein [Oscillospiraceae bacterium]
MAFTEIDGNKLDINPFQLIGKDWALVTAGNQEKFNTMTVSWGNMGVMWNKNIVTAFIRPQRYTHEFLEKGDAFTVSFYPEEMRAALTLCGKTSGRDINKVAEAGLTPVFDGEYVYFQQAKLVLTCKKIYRDRIRPEGFLAEEIKEAYPQQDYHDIFMGEIIKAYIKL